MSVPFRVDAGIGGGPAAGAAATGAAASEAIGAPSWMVLILIAATLVFTALLVTRIVRRGLVKWPIATVVALLMVAACVVILL